MTDKTTAALKLAKEALQSCEAGNWSMSYDELAVDEALAAIREALAEPDIEEMTLTQIASRYEPVKQEPVAGVVVRERLPTLVADRDIKQTDQRLYAAPVKREWVDLTVDEVNEIVHEKVMDMRMTYKDLVRAVIAAFKEKNK